MREIKFRAWDLHKMHYNVYVTGSREVYDPNGGFWIKVENVMQYTGFRDKNGKEIYEGDVVATRVDTRGEVVFYNGAWRVKRGNYKPTPIPAYTWKEVFEVIGNIYENPELLKK